MGDGGLPEKKFRFKPRRIRENKKERAETQKEPAGTKRATKKDLKHSG